MTMFRWMPGDVLGVVVADARGDDRAPVAALRAVALVAEAGHQLGPRRGDALDVFQPGRVGLSLKP